MTLKETVLHELETADDLLPEDLLQVIRWHRLSGRESRKNATTVDRSRNHPLRSIPIVIPANF